MKKRMVVALMAMGVFNVVLAGGLLTNSNQSASFLRNPAREAVIDVDALYTNPAGVAFMDKGWHFGLTGFNAHQQRDVVTTFPLFAANMEHPGETSRRFYGDALAPVAPCFQAAYVSDKWAVGLNYAFGSGGGKCEYNEGIGSIESAYSALLLNAMQPYGINGYSMDAYMKGGVYHYCVSLGGAYKLTETLSAGGGLRAVIVRNNYVGHVNNIALYQNGAKNDMMSAMTKAYDISLDDHQKGLGWTPYLGLDWKPNEHWNFAAKYEFKTRLRLENSSEITAPDAASAVLAQFDEKQNKSIADDVPAILTFGAMYSPIEKVRVSAGWHYYFDKQATKFNHNEKNIDKGSMEFTGGAEWDCLKWLTVSAGWQCTRYRLKDAYLSDMNYNCSSNLFGFGARFHVTDFCSIDLSYMKNFYHRRDVVSQVGPLPKTDHYVRDNYTFGLGVNFDF